jgi:hypothetical protein
MHTTHRTDPAPVAAALWAQSPGVAVVRLTAVWTDADGLMTRHVLATLHDTLGRHLTADLDAHRAAVAVLLAAFPRADWNRQQVYTVASGTLAPPAPFVPADAAPRRPAQHPRRVLLAVEIAHKGGVWTTGRVHAFNRAHGAPKRTTARHDLAVFTHDGFLTEHTAADGHRFYVHAAPRELVGGAL